MSSAFFYVAEDGSEAGPCSAAEVAALVHAGDLTETSLVRSADAGEKELRFVKLISARISRLQPRTYRAGSGCDK